MNEPKLFLSYLKGLLKQWYFTVTLVIGAIDIFIRPFFDIPIPWWVFLSLFGLAFIAANYQLYRQTQDQIKHIREQHQQQLAQTQTEINKLRNRQPRLDLRFVDTNTKRTTLTASKLQKPIDVELLVKQEAQKLEQAYSDLDNSSTSRLGEEPLGIGAIALDAMRHIEAQLHGPRKSKAEYDEDCKKYLREYRRFVFERAVHENHLARYRTLEIEVENTGTQPARDIAVIIDFPDEFHFPTTREEQEQLLLSREPPEAPTVPSLYKPSPFTSIGLSPDFLHSRIYNDLLLRDPGSDLGQSNVSGPFIKPKNSTEVSYEIGQLMHNFIEELEPAGFYLTEAAIGHALELKYSIHATELARPIEGSLIVAVELSQEG